MMHAINKKPGRPSLANTRGIMLLSSIGKLHHALIRRALLAPAQTFRHASQYGGYPGQQTSFASLQLRAFSRVASASGLSQAILYIDARHAFHYMLRSHAFGGSVGFPPRLREVLLADGFDADRLEQLVGLHATAFDQAAPPLLKEVVRDAHTNTWYMVRPPHGTMPECFRTNRGSRPGSPLADLAFNIVMSSLLRDVQQLLTDHPVIQMACARLSLPVPVVTWADDVPVPLISCSAGALLQLTHDLVPAIDRVFQDYGLRLNYAAGKTELMMMLKGAGAPQLRDELLFDSFGVLSLPTGVQLRIVSGYQHLGIAFAQKAAIEVEVRERIKKATAAYRQLSRPLFGNRRLSICLRLQLLESLVLPVLFYASGTWTLLPPSLFKQLDGVIVKWQRRIAGDGFWRDAQTSDEAFRAKWSLPSLALRLAKHRLLFAMQAAKQAPNALFDVLSCEDDLVATSWLNALRHALRWFISEQETHPLRGCALTAAEIFAWLATVDKTQMNLVRRILTKTIRQEQIVHDVADTYRHLIAVSRQHGCSLIAPVVEEEPALTTSFCCPTCTKSFSTIQGLSAHRWRAHQHLSLERYYMDSTVCPACNVCFWSTRRLQQHLKRTRQFREGCFFKLHKYLTPVSHDQARARHDDVPPGLQHVDRLPARPAMSPAPWLEAHGTVWDRELAARQDLLQAQWDHFEYPPALDPLVQREVSDRLTQLTLAWLRLHPDDPPADESIACTWLECLDTYASAHLMAVWTFLDWGQHALLDLFAEILNVDMIQYLEAEFLETADAFPMWQILNNMEETAHRCPPAELPLDEPPLVDTRQIKVREPMPTAFALQNAFLRPLADQLLQVECLPTGIPVVRTPDGCLHMYCLHLFAGRRRDGDCHTHLAAINQEVFPELTIHLLAVDTAVDRRHGNLLAEGYQHAETMAQQGLVALTVSGPPCETWSEARYLEIVDEEGNMVGPRPLRSSQRPWGLCRLTCREVRQLQTGTQLMMRSERLEFTTAATGGAALKEHPVRPRDEQRPSTWTTTFQPNFFAQLPESMLWTFLQHDYGAPSLKPTTLRASRLPTFGRHFNAMKLDPVDRLPVMKLGGQNTFSRGFKTAAAKEYPGPMCLALLRAAMLSLKHRVTREGFSIHSVAEVSPAVCNWIQQLEQAAVDVSRDTFLADYQPH
eukprot:Skav223571  [mRNA]  locus=scaffold34:470903:474406:- [translate_table: standard]